MNEFEIRRALAGAAPAAAPAAADPERLRAALHRADRMQTLRAALMVGALSLVVSLGVFMRGAGEATTPLDVVDIPETPIPDIAPPLVDEPSSETTTIPPTTSTSAPADPGYLDTAPPTTSAPAIITATTSTTTTPPPTTTSPTTTAAPTTTSIPAPTTTAGVSSFSASARYGSCEEPIPYDEYSGTATPGATITITSPWSATTDVAVDGNGDWWVRVEFPSAPVGETFAVRITDGAASTDLDFVRTA